MGAMYIKENGDMSVLCVDHARCSYCLNELLL